MDERVVKQARVLVDYSAGVGEGETVAIRSTTLGVPLVEAAFERVLERGGHPTALIDPPRAEEIFLRTAGEAQLRRPPFFLEVGLDYFDHIILIQAPENTRHASSTDPRRQALMLDGRRALMAKYLEKMMRPERSVTITLHPTPALAQDAAMSLLDYEDFVYRACLLEGPDPLAAWRAMGERQKRICDWLAGRSPLRIEGPNVDLTLRVGGRRWMSDDGRKNFPGGEVFTSPVEDGTEGEVRFTYPAMHQGREIRDVRLWFEGGRVVRAEAATGLAYLEELLALDEGARRLGELAIGTNTGVTRFTGNVLFDEKIGGTCHMAVGRGFANLGSRNESAIHVDMVCDLKTDSRISADGEVFYRNGEFTIV
ncbi:MAG: aminopeptidase [Armatimonadetes bacterium]|nr:aminopeptidase [Armatimonadota bacterium]